MSMSNQRARPLLLCCTEAHAHDVQEGHRQANAAGQSGALCSTVGTQCQRVRLSARAALTAYVRSEHALTVVPKRLSTYLCYRSAFCDGLALRWRLVCALPSPATRRACDEPRSVCTKCVCLYASTLCKCTDRAVYRCCLPVRIV